MIPPRKIAALSLGVVAALGAASLGQESKSRKGTSPGETVVIRGGLIDWLEKSDVSALTEGVLQKIEFQVGNLVEKDQKIGFLHAEKAELAVKKAQIAAKNVGAINKGKAQTQLAQADLARMLRANRQIANVHAQAEIEKAEAEIQVGRAVTQEAEENQKLAEAELEIAKRIVQEHTIIAPFTGYVTVRMKNPEESVRANEAVVQLGRIDKLRFMGYVPIATSFRIHVGDLVEVSPTIDEADLPIERKKFKGKVMAISREISTLGRNDVQVLAEIDNPETGNPDAMLRPGLKADMTIYLTPVEPTTVGSRAGTTDR